MDVLPGLESILGRNASVPEKPRGRPMTAAFGLQGVHAEGADEFDAFDVENAGLNGVDRLNGASLIVKVVKTRECRLRRMLATVAGILDEHRTGGAERAMALMSLGEEANDNGKGRGRGKRGQASNPELRKRTMEEASSSSSGFSRNWMREVLLDVVPCAQRAQPSTLIPGASMPCGAPRVPEQGFIEPVSVELWCRYQRLRRCSSSVEI